MFLGQGKIVIKKQIVTGVEEVVTITAQIEEEIPAGAEVVVVNHVSKKTRVLATIKSQIEAGKKRIIILNQNVKVATGVAETDNLVT